MIELKEGNLLEADVEALVNTVNTAGYMGKGIALQFAKAFPEMMTSYKKACDQGQLTPETLHVYERKHLLNPQYIINFPTKEHWRGKSRLGFIKRGLRTLVEVVKAYEIRSIALPPLGCGLGGLQWKDVFPLIQSAFEALPEVQIWVYPPMSSPSPEHIMVHTKRPEMTLTRATVLQVFSSYCVLGYELTLLEVQKLLYFLQEAGEPLRLDYQKSYYGPYADNLRHVLNLFEGHFTQGIGDGQNKPNTVIRLLPKAIEDATLLIQAQADSHSESKARLHRVIQLIEGFESPYGMELLATVHWLATKETEKIHDAESLIQAVHQWNARKKQVMKRDHILIAWKQLKDCNWL